MDIKRRQEYHDFVKSAWTNAVNHKKGIGEVSQESFIISQASSGYVHVTNPQRIKHIYDRHGDAATEAEQGQRAIEQKDFHAIPDIIKTPSFVIKNIKHNMLNSILYGKQNEDGQTYIYVEQISKKKRRYLSTSFMKLNRRATAKDIITNMRNRAIYDLSEIEVEETTRGGGHPSSDGGHKPTDAVAISANPAVTSLSPSSPEKSRARSREQGTGNREQRRTTTHYLLPTPSRQLINLHLADAFTAPLSTRNTALWGQSRGHYGVLQNCPA